MRYWSDLSPKHQQTCYDLIALYTKYSMDQGDFMTLVHAIYGIMDIPLNNPKEELYDKE